MLSRHASYYDRIANKRTGCFSPQDTVVALQALARYAAISGSNAIDLRLSISDPASSFSVFRINSSNFLAYQRQEVTEVARCGP